ncbi:DUF4240 domain-containing protein [Herbidospora daliensis]|uniref:DUF4240 domain-containing protein n=1 Tax=Herbidospora daliensis TaxID=295585 RepID=UPI000784CA32|nr:DUF4240 domain-containing protein [Herbidospora daliensis]
MQGWCSDDGFWYFQSWLVGLGGDAFGCAATDPAYLAEIPEVGLVAVQPRSNWAVDRWPERELLNYVALSAYDRVTVKDGGLDKALEALGLRRTSDGSPEDKPWDYDGPDEKTSRLARLTALRKQTVR